MNKGKNPNKFFMEKILLSLWFTSNFDEKIEDVFDSLEANHSIDNYKESRGVAIFSNIEQKLDKEVWEGACIDISHILNLNFIKNPTPEDYINEKSFIYYDEDYFSFLNRNVGKVLSIVENTKKAAATFLSCDFKDELTFSQKLMRDMDLDYQDPTFTKVEVFQFLVSELEMNGKSFSYGLNLTGEVSQDKNLTGQLHLDAFNCVDFSEPEKKSKPKI